jgi:hypothetical protein
MATPKAPAAPEAPKPDPPKPVLPAAQARELAREEVTRWQRVLDVTTAAATYEDEAGDLERRLGVLREQRATAEHEAEAAIAAARTAIDKAEADKVSTLARLHDETEAATALLRSEVKDLEDRVAAVQTELIQIERDRDGAKTKLRDELAALEAQKAAMTAEVDDTIHRLGDSVRAKLQAARA